MDFNGMVYVEEIRKRLWDGRAYGKAAVMIGSGFSLNAVPKGGATKTFPLWAELSDSLFDAVYPGAANSKHRRRFEGVSGTLRLAEEYRTIHGDSQLDALLLRSIPDREFEPSALHSLLLDLPWSDVFSTNYDTLLERTFVPGRRYNVVLSEADISIKAKPRIVKLHGSFQSNRPFVVAEEHYRRYPSQFPCFVNLVQQSLMENIFCLLGFSGDDPNFLSWLGWVRDRLGPHAPKVYLCGLLDMPGPQRQTLSRMNVEVVDLSELFPESVYPKSLRHAAAYKWFLEALKAGKPPDPLQWPRSRKPVPPQTEIPTVPPPPIPPFHPGPISPDTEWGFGEVLTPSRAEDLTARWSQIRLSYPGWVVCPIENRRALWNSTERWPEYILSFVADLEPKIALNLLGELVWRLEKCLITMPKSWSEYLRNFVINAKIEHETVEQGLIRRVILLHVLRSFRELGLADEFEALLKDLKSFEKSSTSAEVLYERCLFGLNTLNLPSVEKALSEWGNSQEPPMNRLRKAGILAELGRVTEAKTVALQALEEIRGAQDSEGAISLLSQEAWAMSVLFGLRIHQYDFSIQEEYRGRWDQLRQYNCDPILELERLGSVLQKPPPSWDAELDSQTFDPNISRSTHRFGMLEPVLVRHEAFGFFRALEDSGLLIKAGASVLAPQAIADASKWISEIVPENALTNLIRAGKGETLYSVYDRSWAAQIGDAELNSFADLQIERLRLTVSHIANNQKTNTPWVSQFPLLVELLSRVSIRLRGERLLHVLDLACEIYQDSSLRRLQWREPISMLFRRALESITCQDAGPALLRMVTLPFSEPDSTHDHWFDPFEYLNLRGCDLSEWRSKMPIGLANEYLDALKVADTRPRAILRLSVLHDTGLLTPEETNSFANGLWSMVSDAGLPDNTGLLEFYALQLPSYDPTKARISFLEWLSNHVPEDVLVRLPDNEKNRYSVEPEHAIAYLRNLDLAIDHLELPPGFVQKVLGNVTKWVRGNERALSDERNTLIAGDIQEIERRLTRVIGKLVLIAKPEDVGSDNLDQLGHSVLWPLVEESTKALIAAKTLPEDANKHLTALVRLIHCGNDDRQAVKAIFVLGEWVRFHLPHWEEALEAIARASLSSEPKLRANALKMLGNLAMARNASWPEKIEAVVIAGLGELEPATRCVANRNDLQVTLMVRPAASYLAAVLYEKYKKDGRPTQDALAAWASYAPNDPLPEVRNHWLKGNRF